MIRLTKFIWLLILLPGIFSCEIRKETDGRPKNSADTMYVGTYNIRIITPIGKGSRAWENRRQYVASIIDNYSYDVIGLQEILNYNQLNDLKHLLPNYSFLTVGQDNVAGTKGEMIAIVYDKGRFHVRQSGFFFLSPTPKIPSIGWDASTNRVCQWAKMYDTFTFTEFYFFNTHFNWSGNLSRADGAKLVTQMIDSLAVGYPVFSVGDFNAPNTELPFYHQMTSVLRDSRTVSVEAPLGSFGTFNNWDTSKAAFAKYERMDYVFEKDFDVLSYAILNEKFVFNTWPSDHFPVFVSVVMKNKFSFKNAKKTYIL